MSPTPTPKSAPLEEAPVVIIGGGLSGLTAAYPLFLFDIPCILLEKHIGCSAHPHRAVEFTTRTPEIFHVIGIVDEHPPNGRWLPSASHGGADPRGGYGANTGIGDAHNLAWKLASMLKGHSRQELLASYDAERWPTANLPHDQTFAGPDYAEYRAQGIYYGLVEDGIAIELGQVHASADIIGGYQLGKRPLALRPDDSMGVPGVRGPHVWLVNDGQSVSSLDTFGKDWCLVTMELGWKHVIDGVSREAGVKMRVVCPVNGDVVEEVHGDISRQFGPEKGVASSVTPDGVVVWRRGSVWTTGETTANDLRVAFKASANL